MLSHVLVLNIYIGASPVAQAASPSHGAGKIAHVQEDTVRAEALFVEGLTLIGALGDPSGIAQILNDLGELVLQRGDFARQCRKRVANQ